MQSKKTYKLLFFFLLLFILPVSKSIAQNVSSPYSILGIGDIDTRDYGRYFGSGSTTIARRDEFGYNFSNPASLTALPYKRMNFDIGMRGTVNSFKAPGADTSLGTSKDMVIKRITMAFKISQNTGIAFGLRPYSTVSYQYQTLQPIVTGTYYNFNFINGTGGVNQVYFSIARQLGKHISVGLTPSYLFGAIQQSTNSFSNFLPYNYTKLDITTLYGANLTAGIQYDSYKIPTGEHANDPKWYHRVGLTATVSSQLNGQLTTDYTNNLNTKDSTVQEAVSNASFKLPTSIAFGYSASHVSAVHNKESNKVTLSADINYSSWPNQRVNYQNSFTTSTFRISGGIEYAKMISVQGYSFEKYFLSAGFTGENSYIMLNNNYIKNYGVTFGGGFNLFQKLSIYGGVELGEKGRISDYQIKESYASFVVGFTLKDLWYGTRKFGKFY